METQRPSGHRYRPTLHIHDDTLARDPHTACHYHIDVSQYRADFGPRDEPPIRGISPIGECFRNEGHRYAVGGLLARRSGQPEERMLRGIPGDGIGD